MERVSYHLERLLPCLQLLEERAIFSKQELKHLTSQRRSKETSLIRRHVQSNDYLDYVEWELQVERLRREKCSRLEIPLSVQSKLITYHLSHVISIYERGLRRLKFDVDLWKHYIAWAKSRRMNTVLGRVVARALSLHPTNVELWLAASSYELNQSGSSESARTLLQRGIRLNKVAYSQTETSSSSSSSKKRTKEDTSSESKKKRKLTESDSTSVDKDADAGAATDLKQTEGDLVFQYPKEEEIKYLHLLLSHVRMELVFLERIRRRRMVLGIGENDHRQLKREEEETEDDEDDVMIHLEEEAVKRTEVPMTEPEASAEVNAEAAEATGNQSNPKHKEKRGPSYTSDSQGLQSLLLGSIPLALLKDSLGLSPSHPDPEEEVERNTVQSTNGLPPKLHYLFFIAFSNLVRVFPFLNPDGTIAGTKETFDSKTVKIGSGDRLRKHLLDESFKLFKQRYSPEVNYEILKLLEISRETEDLVMNPLTRLDELIDLERSETDHPNEENPLSKRDPETYLEEESSKNQLLKLNSALRESGEMELNHLLEKFKSNKSNRLIGLQCKSLTQNLKQSFEIVGGQRFPRIVQRVFAEANWSPKEVDKRSKSKATKMAKIDSELKLKIIEILIKFSNVPDFVDPSYKPFTEANLRKYLIGLMKKIIREYLSPLEKEGGGEGRVKSSSSFLVKRMDFQTRLDGLVEQKSKDPGQWLNLKNEIQDQMQVFNHLRKENQPYDKEEELRIWLILLRLWKASPAVCVSEYLRLAKEKEKEKEKDTPSSSGKTGDKKESKKGGNEKKKASSESEMENSGKSESVYGGRMKELNSLWERLIDRIDLSLGVDLVEEFDFLASETFLPMNGEMTSVRKYRSSSVEDEENGLRIFGKWVQFLRKTDYKEGLVRFKRALEKTLSWLNRSSSLSLSLQASPSSPIQDQNLLSLERLSRIHQLVIVSFYKFGLRKAERTMSLGGDVYYHDTVEQVLDLIMKFSKPTGKTWMRILRAERERLRLKRMKWADEPNAKVSDSLIRSIRNHREIHEDNDSDEEEEDVYGFGSQYSDSIDEYDSKLRKFERTHPKPFLSLEPTIQAQLRKMNSFFLKLAENQSVDQDDYAETKLNSQLNQLQFLWVDLDKQAEAMKQMNLVRKEPERSRHHSLINRLEDGWKKICQVESEDEDEFWMENPRLKYDNSTSDEDPYDNLTSAEESFDNSTSDEDSG